MGAPGVGSSPAWIGDQAVLHLIRIFKQAAFGRTGSPRTIVVVRAAVARTDEQPGLREPADGASQVRAIDGENLELVRRDPADPAGSVDGLSVRGHYEGTFKSGESSFAFRKIGDGAEGYPGEIGFAATARDRGKNVADHGNGQPGGDQAVEENAELHEEPAARDCVFV